METEVEVDCSNGEKPSTTDMSLYGESLLVAQGVGKSYWIKNAVLACVAVALAGFTTMVLMVIVNTEKTGQQNPDASSEVTVGATDSKDVYYMRRLHDRHNRFERNDDRGDEAMLPAMATVESHEESHPPVADDYDVPLGTGAASPDVATASTDAVPTTTTTATATTTTATEGLTTTGDVGGGVDVKLISRKRKRLPVMPLMCVFGGNERSQQAPLPADGLCDLAYFDSFYRAGLLNTFAQRTHSAAFERFVSAAAKYRLTEVGVAVATEGNAKAQEELTSPKTWPTLRKLWNSGVVHFGVLDFEVVDGTTPEHVDHIFDLLFLLKELQLRMTTRRFDQWPYLALGIAFLERSDNELFRSFNHHLGLTQVQLLVLRTHLSGRDDTSPECTITGSSVWGEPLARYQPNIMETLEFLRVQNVSLEASVAMISMSLAARYYAPLDSFDPGSKCIALDDAEKRLGVGSFAENCKDGAYVDGVERLGKYEVMRIARTQPHRLVIIFDSEDTIFAKLCKARRELDGVPYGLALFDVELDDATNACSGRNKYGDYTLVRAGRRTLQYVASEQFRQRGRYRDCAHAPP